MLRNKLLWFDYVSLGYAVVAVVFFTGQFIGGYLHPNYIIDLNYYGEAHLELFLVLLGFASCVYSAGRYIVGRIRND